MSHPDDVERLHEIKRLLDRIQQLPHIAGLPNGAANGLHHAPRLRSATCGADSDDAEGASMPDRISPPPLQVPSRNDDLPKVASRALVPVQPKSSGLSPWVFVVATAVNSVVAAALAVVITLGMARREAPTPPPPAEAERVAASIKLAPEAQAEPALPQPVELLPIGSPGEPLQLEPAKPARLPLHVRPDEAIQDSYILILSGLPPNATLSGASKLGTDTWMVAPGALPQIEIVVPEWSTSTIEGSVELRRTNGAVVAQAKLWLAVPPPATPPGAPLSEAALKDLLRNGDRLLDRGDVAGARALYEKAAAMGSAQAALALGTTYDPRHLWSLGVFGTVGNKERAREWYQRAAELGHPEAKGRIAALK